ncbi:hypothetical protein ABGT92_17290 [Streptomyces cinereoruber]|uniref:hypothetical protein n=1 Tax=Streptomyces cinereoruber TaxID=67260 RepID=UPI00345C6AF8
MKTGHRVSLIGAMVLTAGQILLLAMLCFVVVFLVAGGLGPDEPEETGLAPRTPTMIVSFTCGALVIAANAWTGHGLRRAIGGTLPLRTALGRATAVQAVTLAGCLAVGLTPAALTAVPILALLLGCHFTTRERYGRRAAA